MGRLRAGILCVAALGVLVAGPARSQSAPAILESVEVQETAEGTRIDLKSSGRPAWAVSSRASGALVVRLTNCLLQGGLQTSWPGAGLVESVEVSDDPGASPQVTRVTIQTRTRVAYSVDSTVEDRLSLVLTPSPAATSLAVVQLEPERAATARPMPPSPDSAPPVASPGPAFPLEPPASEEFTIGPGDVLEVDVFGLEEFDRKVRVLRDGTISLPLLGNFRIAEYSVQAAEIEIARMLSNRRLVNDPQVSIFVDEFVSRTVSVQGAVEKPGLYPLTGRSTLLDVLGQAGGLSGEQGSQILVLRKAVGGGEQKFEIPTEQLLEQGDLTLNLALAPGDVVIVAQSRKFVVYVTGAVRNPGAVEYSSDDGITVLQAITAAGGPTERANLRNVHVNRRRPDGGLERVGVNAKKIQRGKAHDLELERNDTVVVGEWFL